MPGQRREKLERLRTGVETISRTEVVDALSDRRFRWNASYDERNNSEHLDQTGGERSRGLGPLEEKQNHAWIETVDGG